MHLIHGRSSESWSNKPFTKRVLLSANVRKHNEWKTSLYR